MLECSECGSKAWTAKRIRFQHQHSPINVDTSGKPTFTWVQTEVKVGSVEVECAKCGCKDASNGSWFVSNSGNVVIPVEQNETGSIMQFFGSDPEADVQAEMARLDLIHNKKKK